MVVFSHYVFELGEHSIIYISKFVGLDTGSIWSCSVFIDYLGDWELNLEKINDFL